MKLVILGAAGSGKGTQAKKIAEKYNLAHISTGDIFRENIKNETELGILAKSFTDKGDLVPDSVTNDMIKDRIESEEGFILDGFPRNMAQAEFLGSVAEIDHAILVDVSDEEVMRRISGRYMCKSTGRIYNVYTTPKPQKMELDEQGKIVKAFDDETGEELYHRDDDEPSAVRERLDIFHSNIDPMLNLYETQGKLIKVNGEQDIERVFLEIVEKLNG